MPMHTLYTQPHSKLQVCMTCSGSNHLITTQLNHYHVPHDVVYVAVYFWPGYFYPLEECSFHVQLQLTYSGQISHLSGLNTGPTLSNVNHHTTPKDSIYASFFNPFKMDAKMPSGVSWLYIRQYPSYAQWQVSTMLLRHVNHQMLDPHTVIFRFVRKAQYLYVIYIL